MHIPAPNPNLFASESIPTVAGAGLPPRPQPTDNRLPMLKTTQVIKKTGL
jgi:hypothetical protein